MYPIMFVAYIAIFPVFISPVVRFNPRPNNYAIPKCFLVESGKLPTKRLLDHYNPSVAQQSHTCIH